LAFDRDRPNFDLSAGDLEQMSTVNIINAV